MLRNAALSVETLASLFAESSDCVKLVETDGTLQWMNANGICAMEIADFSLVKGTPWVDFWPAETRATIFDAFEAATTGKTVRFDGWCPTATGAPRWWEVSVSPVKNTSGEHAGFLAVSRNVIAERTAQQALRDALVFAQNLIKTAPTIITIFDLVKQRNVFVGPQVSTLTGVMDLDYDGWSHEVIPAVIHPHDLQRVTAHYAGIRSGKLQPPLQIEYRIGRPDGGWLWLACMEVVHARDSDGRPSQILSASLDITRRHEAEATRDLVMKELEHRIKNAFAMVQSIASMTLRKFCEAEAWHGFEQRLTAMAKSQSLLAALNWQTAPLDEVVNRALRPFAQRNDARINLTGPPVAIDGHSVMALSLVLHELATNACKYGAWSNEQGHVMLHWQSEGENVCLRWSERDGPPVMPPARSGFGTVLIKKMLGVSGGVTMDFRPDGLVCELKLRVAASSIDYRNGDTSPLRQDVQ